MFYLEQKWKALTCSDHSPPIIIPLNTPLTTLPLTLPTPITLASFSFLEKNRHVPCLRALVLTVHSVKNAFPQISLQLTLSLSSCFCPKFAAQWDLLFKIAICVFPDLLPITRLVMVFLLFIAPYSNILCQNYPMCGPLTSNVRITWELVSNANSQGPL